MSYDHARAIRANRGLSPTQKLVALMVADHIGAEGCWASVPTLAAECGLSVRATQTTLRDLVCCGAITRSGVRTVAHGAVVVYGWGLVEVETTHKGCSRCTGEAAAPVQDVHPRGAAGAPVGVQDVHPRGAAGAPKPPHGTTPSEPPHGTTPETHASQPAAEETAWASPPPSDPTTTSTSTALGATSSSLDQLPIGSTSPPSTGPSASRSSPVMPTTSTPPVATTATASSPASASTSDASTAHPVTVSGRPPVAGSGDDALAVAWATARMQRLDPTRVALDRSDVRAIERATRDGATLADLEAIGAWLETPAADWWQGKGYAVAGWRQLLGVDGVKWRERLRDTEARPVVRTSARAAEVQGFFAEIDAALNAPQHEVIDVYDARSSRRDVDASQRRIGAS